MGRGCGGGVGEVGRRRMEGTGKKVGVETKKERRREGRHEGEGEGEEIVHGHGAGDTGVITRPRGRSGSSECISPYSSLFRPLTGSWGPQADQQSCAQTSPRTPTKAMYGGEDWWEVEAGGV